MTIIPLYDRVLVRREEEPPSKGALIIPDSAKEKPQHGIILAVGKGRLGKDGTITPLDVKVGDKIIFGKFSGTEYKATGTELVLLHEEDILAVLG